jgi:E3 ubiquitin-protein ligase NEDD4
MNPATSQPIKVSVDGNVNQNPATSPAPHSDPTVDPLGPLPPGWEQRVNPQGNTYYVNHITRTKMRTRPSPTGKVVVRKVAPVTAGSKVDPGKVASPTATSKVASPPAGLKV